MRYDFENNIDDSSGNSNNCTHYTPPLCPITYATGVGGRPGYYLNGIIYNNSCYLEMPSCPVLRDEGEIEWDQYITDVHSPEESSVFCWLNGGGAIGSMRVTGSIDPEHPQTGGTAASLRYTVDASGSIEEYFVDCVIQDQWQHFTMQWGSFGTRLTCDGAVVGGSSVVWYQGTRNYPFAYIGTNWNTDGDGFKGYIDDFLVWPCSSHGTPTVTPTMTFTKTWTVSMTATITCTATITPTHTITPTFTEVLTDTITPTRTVTCTPTFTPTQTETSTITMTLTPSMTFTISPTLTVTQAPSDFKLAGNFPNPFKDYTRVIVGLPEDCGLSISVYTVSGEKVSDISFEGKSGMNAIYVKNSNKAGIRLSSGIYPYRVKAVFKNHTERVLWKKFAVSD